MQVGTGFLVIVTSSKEAGHTPLLIVHWNTFTPIPNPVTPEVGKDGVVTVAGPLMTVHMPAPTAGVLPARAAVEVHTV